MPGTASNSRLKKSHEFTRLLLEKADMRVVRTKQMVPILFTVAPAKAGAQSRKRSADRSWVPAFAGTTMIACGYHLLELDHSHVRHSK